MAGDPPLLGAYAVLGRIGAGGAADVFLAKRLGHAGFERLVALKRIRPHSSNSVDQRELLIREAKLAASILHPNVVQLFDLTEVDGELFAAMEYVHGQSLAAILHESSVSGNRLPLEVALFIAIELLSGLERVHAMTSDGGAVLNVIHGDVTPHNVLVSYEGEVKLTDFGIARLTDAGGNAVGPHARRGKAPYLSPEQVLFAQVDQRSDVFSAAIVVHELLTCRRLFDGADAVTVVRQVIEKPILAPSFYNPQVSSRLDQIVLRGLAREPGARARVSEMVRLLEQEIDDTKRRAGRRELRAFVEKLYGPIPPPLSEQQKKKAEAQAPASSLERTNIAENIQPVESGKVAAGQLPSVLIADRDPALVRELVDRLSSFDCVVYTADDGERALQLARSKRPAVALVDAALPKLDGFTVVLEIRSEDPDAVLFVMSSRGDEFRQSKALELGADDFFVKPFSQQVVIAKIVRALQKRWSAATSR